MQPCASLQYTITVLLQLLNQGAVLHHAFMLVATVLCDNPGRRASCRTSTPPRSAPCRRRRTLPHVLRAAAATGNACPTAPACATRASGARTAAYPSTPRCTTAGTGKALTSPCVWPPACVCACVHTRVHACVHHALRHHKAARIRGGRHGHGMRIRSPDADVAWVSMTSQESVTADCTLLRLSSKGTC